MLDIDNMVYLIGRLQQAHHMCVRVFTLWRWKIKTYQNSAVGCLCSVLQQMHTWFGTPFGIRSVFDLLSPASVVLEIVDLLNISVWRVKFLVRIKSNTASPHFHVHNECILWMQGKFIKMSSVFATKCSIIDMVLHKLYPLFFEITHPHCVSQLQLYFSVYGCGQLYTLRYKPELR
jgi:hypothetical protein